MTVAKKERKTYEIDGFIFANAALLKTYKEYKAYQDSGIIESFLLPTIQDKKAKSKYGAIKCEIDGFKFDSIMESRFYIHIKQLKQSGDILDFELQPVFELQEGFRRPSGKWMLPIKYVADYRVTDNNNNETIVDVKGLETKDFLLKKKMFHYKFRNLELVCIQYRVKTNSWININEK